MLFMHDMIELSKVQSADGMCCHACHITGSMCVCVCVCVCAAVMSDITCTGTSDKM